MKKDKKKNTTTQVDRYDVKSNLNKLKTSKTPKDRSYSITEDYFSENQNTNENSISSESTFSNFDKYTIEKIDKIDTRINDNFNDLTKSVGVVKDVLNKKIEDKTSEITKDLEAKISDKVSNHHFNWLIGVIIAVSSGFVTLVYTLSYSGLIDDVKNLKPIPSEKKIDTVYVEKKHNVRPQGEK